MRKLKILFITRDHSNSLVRNSYYFSVELAKSTELKVYTKPGNITEILNELSFSPDFILLNEHSAGCCPKITGIPSINIPVGMIIEDTHRKVKESKNFINENNIKYLFTIYRDPFYTFYPEFKDRMYWMPHSINLDIFKDYGLKKDIDYLLMGNVSPPYPLRRKMLAVMEKEPGFVYHKHPGYSLNTTTEFIGEKYAKEINRSKIFLTDGSKIDYALQKYYEVLACKTLLLANTFKEIEDLGFIPDVHFVAVDENNFLEKARYYLVHQKEREQIAQNGYEMVRSKHNYSIRISQFIKMVEEILKNNSV